MRLVVEPIVQAKDRLVWLEKLPRQFPYRGCPVCCRPVDWEYTERDMACGSLGLGRPRCSEHGVQLGWVVVEDEVLQHSFLTGGHVGATKEWGGAGDVDWFGEGA